MSNQQLEHMYGDIETMKKGLEKLKTDNPFHYLEHFEAQVLDNRSVIYKRKY